MFTTFYDGNYHPLSWITLGLDCYQQGQAVAARRQFDRAIQVDPDFADAYNNRNLLYQSNGDLDAALQDFDRAIRLDPELAGAYVNRGMVWKSKQNYELAARDFINALTRAPESWVYRRQVGALLTRIQHQLKTGRKD